MKATHLEIKTKLITVEVYERAADLWMQEITNEFLRPAFIDTADGCAELNTAITELTANPSYLLE